MGPIETVRRIRSCGLLLLVLVCGCWSRSGPEVVVYTALDEEFSAPVLEGFTADSGIAARMKTDIESTKTVGLTEAILAEGDRPRCDVFWNNEILNTIRLERAGLLEPFSPDTSAESTHDGAARPETARFDSSNRTWYGFAARARVLLVNTERVPEADRPRSVRDLADPRWRGQIGLAKPLFGTTTTHAACLFAAWGDEQAKAFFEQLKDNQCQILSGNKQVALSVGAGRLAFGLTDTDDALAEIEQRRPVAIVYPDQGPGGLGTLVIPNTVAVIRGGPHPGAARRLAAYLLSPQVEEKLAAGTSGQIPIRSGAAAPARLGLPKQFKTMDVDFSAAADRWDATAAWLREHFVN